MAVKTYELIETVLIPSPDITRLAIIAMDIYAGDRAFDLELQRGDGSSGAFETIAVIRGFQFSILKKKFTYIDTDLPTGTGLFRYRARHIRNDALPSPYSTPVSALATLIDTEPDEIIIEGGGGGYDPDGTILELVDYTPTIGGGGAGGFFE